MMKMRPIIAIIINFLLVNLLEVVVALSDDNDINNNNGIGRNDVQSSHDPILKQKHETQSKDITGQEIAPSSSSSRDLQEDEWTFTDDDPRLNNFCGTSYDDASDNCGIWCPTADDWSCPYGERLIQIIVHEFCILHAWFI